MSSCRPTSPSSPDSPAGRWVGLTEQISLCGRLLRSHLAEQTERVGLSESQLSLLWACLSATPDGLSQNELAQRLMVSPALVSGLVEQLRRKRLLSGQRDKADRRRQVWRVTATGRTLVQGILGAVADWASQLDSRLETQNVEQLGALMAQLIGTLGNPSQPEEADVPSSGPTRHLLALRKRKGAAA